MNYLLHSIFRSVYLQNEGTSITQNPTTYAYKAFFETLGCIEEAKVGFLNSVLCYNESNKNAVLKERTTITPSTIATNGYGKSIDLCGKLHLDLVFQPNALIGGWSSL